MTTYIVPVSGGKDSQLTLARAIDKHGRKNVRAIHEWTGHDHPLTVEDIQYLYDHGQFPDHQRRGLDKESPGGCSFCKY